MNSNCIISDNWKAGLRTALLTGVAAVALSSSLARAQDQSAYTPEQDTTEVIVVTAQKREENIQSVPLSIVALSAKKLEAAGITAPADLERIVPGLRFDQTATTASYTLRIRGIGASSNSAIDPSVAAYIDGAFLPHPGVLLSNFLDVNRVEVLRGPQGTLFGRNSTVGALSISTYAPSLTSASATVAADVGSFGRKDLQVVGNLPIIPNFAVRAAMFATTSDGYYKNSLDGRTYGARESVGGRLSAKWNITDNLNWIGRFDYAHVTGDGVHGAQTNLSTASAAQISALTARLTGNVPNLTDTYSDNLHQVILGSLNDKQYGFTSDLKWQTDSGYTLRLIQSYRDWKNYQLDGDILFLPLPVLNRTSIFASRAQSHELQFVSPKGALFGGRFDYVAGLYSFKESYLTEEDLNLGAQYCSFVVAALAPSLVTTCLNAPQQKATHNRFRQATDSLAIYAQGTYSVTPTIDLIVGVRETQDKKTGQFDQVAANPTAGRGVLRAPENTPLFYRASKPSYRANLNWKLSPDAMVFATYATGYKSGGFNSTGSAAALGDKRHFGAEDTTDVELGMKTLWFDKRLLLNATAYRMELTNFQERSFDGSSFIVRNAGNVRAQGVELESSARINRRFKLEANLAYLDSVFLKNTSAPGLPGCKGGPASCPIVQDLSGRPTTFAPQWHGNVAGEFSGHFGTDGLGWTWRNEMDFESGSYTTPDLNRQAYSEGFTLFRSRFTIHGVADRWTLVLYGDNLTNERYYTNQFEQPLAAALGVRDSLTGATLYRPYVGAPRAYGARLSAKF